MKKATIVVLGDVGRSPRMQYHASSLARENFKVNIIGYKGSNPIQCLSSDSNVKFYYMMDCPKFNDYLPTLLGYICKTLWQSITLMLSLILAGIPDYILVQNPPALPTLGVVYFFSLFIRSHYVIDWHNYAYSILALSLKEHHPLVRICKAFEFGFGARSQSNLCVTRGMKDDLLEKNGIKAVTFYDRPFESFTCISLGEKHDLMQRLGSEYDILRRDCEENETIFTTVDDDGVVSLRPDRPGLLISSTSWTEDEDFGLLLDALQEYEDSRISGAAIPRLVVVITGRGPLKEFYKAVIARRSWKHVQVLTPWLSAEDYPKFLACGDLGVCLHYSSSGLDLPMKVVDMFGSGLPVCAVKFKCLHELVVHKENGMVFERSHELSTQIQDWFKGFPLNETEEKKTIRANVENFRQLQWHENWLLNVKPIFT